jgi:hypothetical protein
MEICPGTLHTIAYIFVVIFDTYVLVMEHSYICLCTGLRYFFSPVDGRLAKTGISPSRLHPIDDLFVCLLCTCLILNLYICVCTRLGREDDPLAIQGNMPGKLYPNEYLDVCLICTFVLYIYMLVMGTSSMCMHLPRLSFSPCIAQ